MKKFIKKIDGGLDLDVQIERLGVNKLSDAINVSSHNFNRKQGELNASLGFSNDGWSLHSKCLGQTIGGIEKWSMANSAELFSKCVFVHSHDAGDQSFIVANGLLGTNTKYTAFYTAERHKADVPEKVPEQLADHNVWNLTEVYVHEGEFIDESFSFATYSFYEEKFMFITKDNFAMRVLVNGANVKTELTSFNYDPLRESSPIIKNVRTGPSMAIPSMTRYVYRILYIDGTHGPFSSVSNIITIPADYPEEWSSDETMKWSDPKYARLIKSNILVTVHVDVHAEENVARIELYAMRYITNEGLSPGPAIVELVGDSANGKIIDFIDGVAHFPTEVTNSDIEVEVLIPPVFESGAVCAIKDEILYVGNTREHLDSDTKNAAFDAWDARVWQLNSDKKAIDSTGTEYTLEQLYELTTSPTWLQIQNCLLGRDSSTSTIPLLDNAGQPGAIGKNIHIGFIKGKLEVGGVYPEAYQSQSPTTTSYGMSYENCNVASYFRGLCAPSHSSGMDTYDGQWYADNTTKAGVSTQKTVDFTDGEDAYVASQDFASDGEPLGHSFANPRFASRYRSMQHDSVYRIGIYFIDERESASQIKWLGDIRTPSLNTYGFRLCDNARPVDNGKAVTWKSNTYTQFTEMVMYPIYMLVKLGSIPAPYTRARIVYAKRELYNRNVILTGVMHALANPIEPQYLQNRHFRDCQRHSLPPLPHINSSQWFFGGREGIVSFDGTNAGSDMRWAMSDSHTPGQNADVSTLNVDENYVYAGVWRTLKPSSKDERVMKMLTAISDNYLNIKNPPAMTESALPCSGATATAVLGVKGVVGDFTSKVTRTEEHSKTSADGTTTSSSGWSETESHTPNEQKHFNMVCSARFRAHPVEINAMTAGTARKRLYNFYAPELDHTDDADNPFISSMAEQNISFASDHSVCTHAFLTSLMASTSLGKEIAAVHSIQNKTADRNTRGESWVHSMGYFRDAQLVTNEYSNTKYDHNTFAGTNYAGMETYWVTSGITRQPRAINFYEDTEGYKDDMVKTFNSSVSLKTAKYFIMWDQLQGGEDVTTLNLTIKAGRYSPSPIKLSEDMFQYLWPCTFSAHVPPAYPGGAFPQKIEAVDVGTNSFVNICPLWSGKFIPTHAFGEAKSLMFAETMMYTEMTDKSRNHMFSLYRTAMATSKFKKSSSTISNLYGCPFGLAWANRDAFITPLSDHGAENFVDVDNIKFGDGADGKANKPFAKSKFVYDSARVHYPYTLQTPSRLYSPLTNRDIIVSYGSGYPTKNDYVFPDVSWVNYISLLNDYIPPFCFGGYTSGSSPVFPNGNFKGMIADMYDDVSKVVRETMGPGTSPDTFENFTMTLDLVSGLNYHGYGGNAITFDFDSNIPAFEDKFRVSHDKSGHHLFKRTHGATSAWGGDYMVHYSTADSQVEPDYLDHAIHRASHVVLSTVRSKVVPFKSDYIEMADWIECAPESEITLNEDGNPIATIITGFDMFVGIHKRMYMNAFYANGVGARSDASLSSSAPIQMMFPTETMINLDIANPCSELRSPANRNNAITPRISHFAGYKFPIAGYTQKKKDFTYNSVFSSEFSSKNQLVVNQMIRREVFFNRLWYATFNHNAGRFNAFKAGDSIDLDRQYGAITGIVPSMDRLVVLQERAMCVLNPSQPTVLADAAQEQRPVYIGSGRLFASGIRYTTTDSGMAKGDRAYPFLEKVYWVDRDNQRIMRFNQEETADISTIHGVRSWVKDILTVQPQAPYRMHELEDGNRRLAFNHSRELWGTFKFRPWVQRNCMEINESRDAFMSFITIGAPIVSNISGKNMYLYNAHFITDDSEPDGRNDREYTNRVFSDGRYDAYYYYEDRDVDPSVGMFINPMGDIKTDKEFNGISVPIVGTGEKRLVFDMEMKLMPEDAGGLLTVRRCMQTFMYPYTTKDNKGEKMTDDAIVSLVENQVPKVISDAIMHPKTGAAIDGFTSKVLKQVKKTDMVNQHGRQLGTAVPFGYYVYVPLNKVDQQSEVYRMMKPFIGNTPVDAFYTVNIPIRGFGFHLNMRMHDFSESSTNMLGQKFDTKVFRVPTNLGVRTRIEAYFNDISVAYAALIEHETETGG
ncbi:hypothetical protein [Azobacteroides phage ProJPt-Bp1]|uniref:Crassvirus muzzle protein N-terminal region domain-containing protein n=1 Tax=Azobacteroides phage ProJPt-Bp1 TaxID=1920526 RepID=A0A1V1FIP3_9CAUD|nr:hypothetical protein KNT10_gp14 [Azobacteroides phage ProJPt-Bp1]BAX03449.1 hypothetical protein [Azobacteroides phage ProJPt-Bp1]